MYSMTGYGRGQITDRETRVIVEVQSVNKRQPEIVINLPSRLAQLEADVRTAIGRRIQRGRVTVTVSFEKGKSLSKPALNQELARNYLHSFEELRRILQLPGAVTLEMIVRAPGVLEVPEATVPDQTLRHAVLKALESALDELLAMRAVEGSHLLQDLSDRIKKIRTALEEVVRLQPRASERYRSQLLERAQRLNVQLAADEERLLREIVLFAERSNFSEELTRLESHLQQFMTTSAKDEPMGRALEFLTQEIGRELNTLSAKANDAEISQIIVFCKAEMEKIREQVQNVE